MRPVVLLWLAACGADEGQKVRALLIDHAIECVSGDDGVAVATVDLEQPEDLYVAEALVVATGDRLALSAVRRGRRVTFTCPEGLAEVTVRTATVLTSTLEAPSDDEPTPAPP